VITLRPITTAQSFSIIPSSFAAADLNAATITLTENGTDQSQTSVNFSWDTSLNGNYIIVTMTPSLTLREDYTYSFKLATATEILYRDLIYVTTKTDKEEVFAYPESYTKYSDGDDKYIVL
jgi:hypothetical protein